MTGNEPLATSDLAAHPAINRVSAALEAAGLADRILILADYASTAAIAAEALGVEVAQIANSLVFELRTPASADTAATSQPLLILASGAHRVDLARVATVLGVPKVHRANADFVREHSGFAIGGVAPVGHLSEPVILIDASLAEAGELWAAAGHPRSLFRLSFDELVQVTGGQVAQVA